MSILSNTDCRRLDQRIVVQQKIDGAQDPVSGVVSFVWTTFVTLWACVDATKANERYLGQQEASGKGYTVWVRWRGDLNENMRILWNGEELNIISIPDNQKRGRFMSIFATAGENEG